MSKNATLTILGCAGSAGVPSIGNRWGSCDPMEPKNRRNRCSALLSAENACVIIDTGPDFRAQMNNLAVPYLDAVLYTHFHGDHINGFEELRNIYNANKKRGRIPLYADAKTKSTLLNRYPHMFDAADKTGFYPLPIEFQGWENGQNEARIGDLTVQTIPMMHGPDSGLGYRVNDVAYCTDVSKFEDDGYAALDGVKTLIIDCNNMFQYDDGSDYLHFNFEGVQRANEKIGATDVVLTHLKNTIDYMDTMAKLPKGYRLAYDGLVIDL